MTDLGRLDPRTKLAALVVLALALVLARGPLALAACGAWALAALAAARLTLAALAAALGPVTGLLAVTVVADGLLVPGGVRWHLGPLGLSPEGLETGAVGALRVALLVAASAAVIATTDPVDLTAAAEALLRPLERLRLPVGDWALMAAVAVRFLPTLGEEAQRLLRAQRTRGAEFRLSRPDSLMAFAVPLVLGAFRRAEELAVALEARGYAGTGRTRWRPWRWGRADQLTAVGLLLTCALAALTALGSR